MSSQKVSIVRADATEAPQIARSCAWVAEADVLLLAGDLTHMRHLDQVRALAA